MTDNVWQDHNGQFYTPDATGEANQYRYFATRREAEIYARRTQMATAMADMETLTSAMMEQVQNLIDSMAKPSRIWAANGLTAVVADTLDGELVPDSIYTKERWLAISELFDEFAAWLQTPLPGCKLPPMVIVSQRGG